MEGIGRRYSFRLFAILPRLSAIILAVLVLAVSATTIGVINDNKSLVAVRDYDGPLRLPSSLQDLQKLINGTLAAAGWLILMTIGIMIAEIIAIILLILDLQSTVSLIFGIIEILFSIAVIVCYLATGVACAAYAGAWGGPPDPCIQVNTYKDVCDSIPLTATNTVQTVFCILQMGVFGGIILMTAVSLMKMNRTQRATDLNVITMK